MPPSDTTPRDGPFVAFTASVFILSVVVLGLDRHIGPFEVTSYDACEVPPNVIVRVGERSILQRSANDGWQGMANRLWFLQHAQRVWVLLVLVGVGLCAGRQLAKERTGDDGASDVFGNRTVALAFALLASLFIPFVVGFGLGFLPNVPLAIHGDASGYIVELFGKRVLSRQSPTATLGPELHGLELAVFVTPFACSGVIGWYFGRWLGYRLARPALAPASSRP